MRQDQANRLLELLEALVHEMSEIRTMLAAIEDRIPADL